MEDGKEEMASYSSGSPAFISQEIKTVYADIINRTFHQDHSPVRCCLPAPMVTPDQGSRPWAPRERPEEVCLFALCTALGFPER